MNTLSIQLSTLLVAFCELNKNPVASFYNVRMSPRSTRPYFNIMEWIKQKITFIFTRNVSTEQLTMSIVLGITCGLFPVPFLTTFVCLLSSIFISVNVPIMTTVNLMITPIELGMIPMFVMAGNYLSRLYTYDLDEASFNISDLMASSRQDALKGVREFADILIVAVFAWIIFAPIASAILYFLMKPLVAKMMIKFEKRKSGKKN